MIISKRYKDRYSKACSLYMLVVYLCMMGSPLYMLDVNNLSVGVSVSKAGDYLGSHHPPVYSSRMMNRQARAAFQCWPSALFLWGYITVWLEIKAPAPTAFSLPVPQHSYSSPTQSPLPTPYNLCIHLNKQNSQLLLFQLHRLFHFGAFEMYLLNMVNVCSVH